jgi:glycosyltransferase involved in cell wall biosynthesis
MLTVLVATHNGAPTLPRMLAAMDHLKHPAGGWKLVIVDNASTDDTAAIIGRFADRLPILALKEAERGKNRALNSGLAACEGDLIVFADDDILPEPEWLTQYRAAADAHEEATVFGGPVLLKWDETPPDWLLKTIPLAPAFACNLPREASGPMAPTEAWGNNLAIRAGVFEQGLRFCEQVGPGPGNYVMGGETELLGRLAAEGRTGWFVNEARVHHIVRAYQISLSWLRRRAYRFGRHLYDREHRTGETPDQARHLLGIPRWLLRAQVADSLRLLWAHMQRDRHAIGRLTWTVYERAGYLAELRRRKG